MVKRWYADFKCGRTDTNDAERSGHPDLAVVPENTKELHKLILANHKLKLREKAEELKIRRQCIYHFAWTFVNKKAVFKVGAHLLSVDQKQHHVNDSEHCLQLFQINKKQFLHRYVTMNKIWIRHFTPESNRQSAEWTAAGETRLKWPKMQIWYCWKWQANLLKMCALYRTLHSYNLIWAVCHLFPQRWRTLTYSVSGNHWPGEPCDMLKTMSCVWSLLQDAYFL